MFENLRPTISGNNSALQGQNFNVPPSARSNNAVFLSMKGPVNGFSRDSESSRLTSSGVKEGDLTEINTNKSGWFKSLLQKGAMDGTKPTIAALSVMSFAAYYIANPSLPFLTNPGQANFLPTITACLPVVFGTFAEKNNFKFGETIGIWFSKIKNGWNSNLKLTPPSLIRNGLDWLKLTNYSSREWPLRALGGIVSLAAGVGLEVTRGAFAVSITAAQSISKPLRFMIESACRLATATKVQRGNVA